jgi:uncharacterized protein YqeY
MNNEEKFNKLWEMTKTVDLESKNVLSKLDEFELNPEDKEIAQSLDFEAVEVYCESASGEIVDSEALELYLTEHFTEEEPDLDEDEIAEMVAERISEIEAGDSMTEEEEESQGEFIDTSSLIGIYSCQLGDRCLWVTCEVYLSMGGSDWTKAYGPFQSEKEAQKVLWSIDTGWSNHESFI